MIALKIDFFLNFFLRKAKNDVNGELLDHVYIAKIGLFYGENPPAKTHQYRQLFSSLIRLKGKESQTHILFILIE